MMSSAFKRILKELKTASVKYKIAERDKVRVNSLRIDKGKM